MSFKKQAAKGEIPSARTQSSICCVDNKVFMFGGTNLDSCTNDVFLLDTDKWNWSRIAASGEIPAARWGHSATAVGKKMFVFGGDTVGGKVANLVIFDTESNTWTAPKNESGAGVSPRSCHTSTLVGKRLFIYGGDDVVSEDHALAVLNTETLEWSIPNQGGDGAPEPRKGHVTALWKSKLVIYGGWGTRCNEYLSDVWTLDTDTMVWKKAPRKGPVPEARGGAVGTVFNNKLFVWGGWGSGPHMWNELHYMEMDDFTWLKRKAMGAQPDERFYHCAVPLKENLLLVFGGQKQDKSHINDLLTISTANVY